MLTGTAQCGATFQIMDTSRPSFVIVPEVGNCFSCPSTSSPSVQWQVVDRGAIVQLSGAAVTPIGVGTATATVVQGYLVISAPQEYVLPGVLGRRDILCSDDDANIYEARLLSPGL